MYFTKLKVSFTYCNLIKVMVNTLSEHANSKLTSGAAWGKQPGVIFSWVIDYFAYAYLGLVLYQGKYRYVYIDCFILSVIINTNYSFMKLVHTHIYMCMFVCVCLYICICVCVCVYIYSHTHICAHALVIYCFNQQVFSGKISNFFHIKTIILLQSLTFSMNALNLITLALNMIPDAIMKTNESKRIISL